MHELITEHVPDPIVMAAWNNYNLATPSNHFYWRNVTWRELTDCDIYLPYTVVQPKYAERLRKMAGPYGYIYCKMLMAHFNEPAQ